MLTEKFTYFTWILRFYGREAEKYCCIFVVHPGFNSTQETRIRTYPLLIISPCLGMGRNLHLKSVLLIALRVLNVEVCSEERRNESLPSVIGTCTRQMPMQWDSQVVILLMFWTIFLLYKEHSYPFRLNTDNVQWIGWLDWVWLAWKVEFYVSSWRSVLSFLMVVIHHFGFVTQS